LKNIQKKQTQKSENKLLPESCTGRGLS